MTNDEQVTELYLLAANENREAFAFLSFFHEYLHGIDDMIDNKERDPEKFLALLIQANLLYSMPYYVRHAHRLHVLVAQITNAYADSLAWEKAGDWQGRWADVLRFAGNEMVVAVAYIEGDFPLMRKLSPMIREVAWFNHHNEKGDPE